MICKRGSIEILIYMVPPLKPYLTLPPQALEPQGLVTIFIFFPIFRVLGKKIKIVTSPCARTYTQKSEIRNILIFIGLKSINRIVTKKTIHTIQTFDIKVYI